MKGNPSADTSSSPPSPSAPQQSCACSGHGTHVSQHCGISSRRTRRCSMLDGTEPSPAHNSHGAGINNERYNILQDKFIQKWKVDK